MFHLTSACGECLFWGVACSRAVRSVLEWRCHPKTLMCPGYSALGSSLRRPGILRVLRRYVLFFFFFFFSGRNLGLIRLIF
ncbi:hypothetical protein GQ53DRAFT_70169 [Thozetella sp. PMI_491]|nr:hypothetical protein GQ53DRAFT_70169 [Thozetella sp. PMI_491]